MEIRMTDATRIVLASRPTDAPVDANFRSEHFTIGAPRDDEVLLRVRYLSLDPYMRGRMSDAKSYAPGIPIGGTLVGGTVGEVLESRADGFSRGDWVLSYSGWQTHAIAKAETLRRLDPQRAPVSTALGVLGMPGFTAWSGLAEIGRPKAGETLVVAAATGPVGSAVGQIAKLQGARVIGIAGGEKKCTLLKEMFGFDVALDHRDPALKQKLAEACPHGVDVYFENVGGAVWDAVFPLFNEFARVPVCGLVADYNKSVYHGGAAPEGPDRLPFMMREVLAKSLTVRGFIQREFIAREGEFLHEMAGWIEDGKIRYLEDFVDGLENAPSALTGLLEGRNVGKVIVRV